MSSLCDTKPNSKCTREGSWEESEEDLLGVDVLSVALPLWRRAAPAPKQGLFIHQVCVTETLSRIQNAHVSHLLHT